VVLENPVAENREEMKKCIVSFSKYAYENGLKEIYYRVPKRVCLFIMNYQEKVFFLVRKASLISVPFS